MKLTRLELRNWCQHESLDIDFPSAPIIRLCGPNNAGKSNIIRAIGRALAQGRTDFERTSGLRYGTNSGSIRLFATTHEHLPFAVSRTLGKGGHVTLEFEDQMLVKAEEITKQLEAWFGPQETLLQLFIARQGKISSLLVEKGRDRLRKFIEICGFKGFLEKQSTLNRFIKAYPTIYDQSALLEEVQAKQQEARQFEAEKQQVLAGLPPLKELEAVIAQLEQRRTLRTDTQVQFERKRPTLEQKQRTAKAPLTDLAPISQRIDALSAGIKHSQACAAYQSHVQLTCKLGVELQSAEAALAGLPEDTTNYAGVVQQTSRSLQQVGARQKVLAQEAHAYTQAVKDLKTAEAQQEEKTRRLSRVNYSLQWQKIPLQEIAGLQELLIQKAAAAKDLARAQSKVQALEAAPAPSSDVLKASQITRDQLTGLQELHRHAQGTADGPCPMCLREWSPPERQQRCEKLAANIQETETALSQASTATQTYQKWASAQAGLPAAKEQAKALLEQHLERGHAVEAWRGKYDAPENDFDKAAEIIQAYRSVAEALQPVDLESLRGAVQREEEKKVAREKEELQLSATMARLNQELIALLQKQTAASLEAQKRARIQQTKETLQARLSEAEKVRPTAVPAGFQEGIDYVALLGHHEAELAQAQATFARASSDWATSNEAQKEIETLKGEIQAAETRLAELTWGDEEEFRLTEARRQKELIGRREAEIALIRSQCQERAAQICGLQKIQKQFLIQADNITNMGAVSDFLSYDNGPQKFLTGFLQEALNQTNILLSEMGLPVKLHLGEELEILVQDRNSQESPAAELGGGYSNLIGIAFRIALQKMILPKVHVIILDEPSTHVDPANMELLIPFFDRLKENLSSYGIEQLILIDHHPDWKESNVGLIPVGGEIESAGKHSHACGQKLPL